MTRTTGLKSIYFPTNLQSEITMDRLKYILPTGPWLFNHGPGGSIMFQPVHGYSNHGPVGSINF